MRNLKYIAACGLFLMLGAFTACVNQPVTPGNNVSVEAGKSESEEKTEKENETKPEETAKVTATATPTEIAAKATETPKPEATKAPDNKAEEKGTETKTEEKSEKELKAPVISFSDENYFHSSAFNLSLKDETGKKGAIYYTLDGKEPTKNSKKYTGSIKIDSSDDNYGYPKAVVVHAKSFYEDGTESTTSVHSYFVSSKIDNNFSAYVFMLSGDPADLTERTGILSSSQTIQKGVANYNVHGMDGEREVFLEVLTGDGTPVVNQFCGVRVHGAYNRQNEVKSLKLIARKSYGSGIGKFKYNFFGTLNSKGKEIKSYDKLVLRSYGNDWVQGYLRDELNERLAEAAGFDCYEAVKVAYVYLNGEFYNYVWLHESYCDDYFKEKFKEKDRNGEFVILEGEDKNKKYDEDESNKAEVDEFNEMYNKYAYSELTDARLRELEKEIDVYGYLDYFAFNVYMNNWDWPQNNYKVVKYYKADGEKNGEGMYDGRWHFLLHDMDYCYGLYGQARASANHDNLGWILKDQNETETITGWGNTWTSNTGFKRYAPLFATMMKRTDLRDYFIKQVMKYGKTVFSQESISRTLDSMTKEQSDIQRYRDFLQNKYGKSNSRSSNLQQIKDFSASRMTYMVKFMSKAFGISEGDIREMGRQLQ